MGVLNSTTTQVNGIGNIQTKIFYKAINNDAVNSEYSVDDMIHYERITDGDSQTVIHELWWNVSSQTKINNAPPLTNIIRTSNDVPQIHDKEYFYFTNKSGTNLQNINSDTIKPGERLTRYLIADAFSSDVSISWFDERGIQLASNPVESDIITDNQSFPLGTEGNSTPIRLAEGSPFTLTPPSDVKISYALVRLTPSESVYKHHVSASINEHAESLYNWYAQFSTDSNTNLPVDLKTPDALPGDAMGADDEIVLRSQEEIDNFQIQTTATAEDTNLIGGEAGPLIRVDYFGGKEY